MLKKIFGNSQENNNKKSNNALKNKASKKSKIPENESIDYIFTNDFRNKGTKLGLSKNHLEILKNANFESSAKELREMLNRTNATKFKNDIINPLLKNGFFELTNPDSPKSPKQKYRLTGKFVKNKIEDKKI
jgi:hypothetical protein